MNITITGGKGFVGSHLVPLLNKNHSIIIWDLVDGKDIFNPEIEEDIESSDVVIHLAALTSVGDSFERPDEYARTNILGTARIVDFCRKHNKRLIHMSTASVYTPESSPYAKTKHIAEEIVFNTYRENSVILRPFNIYGTNINDRTGSVMWQFLQGCKSGEILVFGNGEQTRDLIHVDNVVDIIKEAVEGEWNDVLMDVGTGESFSMNYLAELFIHHYNGEVKIRYEEPKREIKWSSADTTTLKILYPDIQFRSISEGVKEILENED